MIILQALTYLLTVLTFLPLVRDKYWIFRALEYPRLQKLFLVLALLAGWGLHWYLSREISMHSFFLLGVCAIYLFIKVFPYTPFATKEVANASSSETPPSVRIFTANVYQDNTRFEDLLKQIRDCRPHIVLLMETDKKWVEAVSELDSEYAWVLKVPRDDTYGMVFLSNLPLREASVRYLVKDSIPSVSAIADLGSGTEVALYGLHPEPPVPGESLRSTAKDRELMKIAGHVRDANMPAIVMGDLNDVAWSYTTALFKKEGRLFDVRCGRGFYSTFNAKLWFIRFPLDYIFCTEHFALRSMKRLKYNGSDHFPICTELIFAGK
jgi:endonuclease/exonuclease/phosphatase (EEP) superfamily protein YafD